ncbi:hypothetical protein K3495_g1369 [Podosphaera aphanis]|nr:hypothetical protein K3495_g1369 [Podosphaera aphanis]
MKTFVPTPSLMRAEARRLFSQSRRQNKVLTCALNKKLIKASVEILEATERHKPVVALASTVYTHDLPCPENIRLALDLEDIVRKYGAIPATIGVVDGVATIGLTEREIIDMCCMAGRAEIMRVDRSDLPFILGMGVSGRPLYGGTTVSATMYLARWMGIHVLGIGGIDGVHHSGQDSLDLSSDLTELGRCPITVVSSGCKRILDTHQTLNYLKAQGVMTVTFADGRKGDIEFPSLCSRNSGIKSHLVVEDARQAATISFVLSRLSVKQSKFSKPGILFANPIPEKFSTIESEINEAVEIATSKDTQNGINDNATTPYITSRIEDVTQNCSLQGNRASIESNLKIAAKIAVQLSILRIEQEKLDQGKLRRAQQKPIQPAPVIEKTFSYSPQKELKGIVPSLIKRVPMKSTSVEKPLNNPNPKITKYFNKPDDSTHGNTLNHAQASASRTRLILEQESKTKVSPRRPPLIFVFGAIAIALRSSLVLGPTEFEDTDFQPCMKTSNNARIETSLGGCGYNVALAAQLTNETRTVRLCSLVADDFPGKMIMDALKSENFDIKGIKVLPTVILRSGISIPNHTAQYITVNDGKKDLVLGMDDMQIFRQNNYLIAALPASLKWAIIDASWKPKLVRWLMRTIRTRCSQVKIAFQPVSGKKSERGGADIFRTSITQSGHEDLPNALSIFPNHVIDLVAPNVGELEEMFNSATLNDYFKSNDHWSVLEACGVLETQSENRYREFLGEKSIDYEIVYKSIQLLPYMSTILTQLGSKGVLLAEILRNNDPRLEDPDHARWIFSRTSIGYKYAAGIYVRLYPPTEIVDPDDIVSAKGASDTFLGVLISGLSRTINLDENLINIAQKSAAMSLKCKEAVSPSLCFLKRELDQLYAEELAKNLSRNSHGVDYTKSRSLQSFLDTPADIDKVLDDSGAKASLINNICLEKVSSEELVNVLNEGDERRDSRVPANIPKEVDENQEAVTLANISKGLNGEPDMFIPTVYSLPPLPTDENDLL